MGVTVTFAVVFAYLGPYSPGGISSMLMNSNLFFHLFIPVLSIIAFTVVERNNKLVFKDTLYGLITPLLYSLYYATNVLIHIENGAVSTDYDWYWFVQDGLHKMFIVAPLILISTYVLSLIIWRINKKK